MPLLGLLWLFAHERRSRLEQALELRNAYLGTTILLADLIEGDDEYTGAHSQGVVAMSVKVAEELGLDPWQRRRTEYAARLHDVGKIAIPKEIINKPGPLDAHEWTLMREHTVEGERMLSRVGGALSEVGAIVRGSHERWDGSGYPDGLTGQEIPIEARIVACCDAFDAMTTDRSYRQALPLDVASTTRGRRGLAVRPCRGRRTPQGRHARNDGVDTCGPRTRAPEDPLTTPSQQLHETRLLPCRLAKTLASPGSIVEVSRWAGQDSNLGPTDYELTRDTSG